jgi:alkanesulfonate monooxygenase SsuD/methylene tetrahydromethanopterin reductase-like flavin-dependent oxidoreductase (luciferase family)
MRPKVIVQLYPVLPAADEEDRKRRRPLGRDAASYQRVLHDWLEVIRAADDMGVWGVSTIEHHLHSEGYQVGPNPGVLNAWWAGQVKNLHVGALGYVMTTQDPIRVAEETAILDHITKGKYFVGFARGYQSRWTNILGQFTESVATTSVPSVDDERNRKIFEERVEMVLRCWENDSIVLDGQYYQAPYPIRTGIENYPAVEIAREAGAPGEIDLDGNVRRISVVPRPFQKPHPPVMIATSKSDQSVQYCARKGFIPVYFMNFDNIVRQAQLYVEEATKAGRNAPLGARQNIARWVHIAGNEADYRHKLEKYDADIFKNLYSAFTPELCLDKEGDLTKTIAESGMYSGGTLLQVRSEWQRMYEALPAEYITLIFHFAQQPGTDLLCELEQFMTKIVPHLDAAEAPAPGSVSTGA